jgi:hypothetical protein
MGWRPWNCFRNVFTQQTMRMAVDALTARIGLDSIVAL